MTFAAAALAAWLLLFCPPAEAYPAGIKGHARRLGEALLCAFPGWLCGQAGIDLRFEASLLLAMGLAVPFAFRALVSVVVVRATRPAGASGPVTLKVPDVPSPALEAAFQQARQAQASR